MREEKDALGKMEVSDEHLWGAQTERSLRNFHIGTEKIPREIIQALLLIKKAAAMANFDLGCLSEEKKGRILQAINSISEEDLEQQFPLSVFQTGSGTQTNMNVNEVVANKANLLAGSALGAKFPIHPNDDVNKSQSSNDTFPSAMHIAFITATMEKLIPALKHLQKALEAKASVFYPIIKVGRTHLQDAVPIRLGQEFSGYAAQIQNGIEALQLHLPKMAQLALGGTAVGTGFNCPKGFKERAIAILSQLTYFHFVPAKNSFEALASHDSAVEFSGILSRIACSLFKIANDIRFLSCGPRCGIAELHLPENEPGSSIMPGKINPTQCEAVIQVCCQVIGNNTAVTVAGTQGQLELSTVKPVIAKNCLESIGLLSDVCNNFTDKCIIGITPDEEHINYLLTHSLMLATGLSKVIGYDKAAEIALYAQHNNLTLKQAALELGIDEKLFDSATDPKTMV